MSARDIYDFEGIVEATTVSLFLDDNDISAISTQNPRKLRRDRPRVEVLYVHGSGRQQMVLVGGTTIEYRRERAWNGQLKLELVTDADIQLHTAFRCQVRSLMAAFWLNINAKPGDITPWSYGPLGKPLVLPPGGRLRNHKLQSAGDGGTSPVMSGQGYLQTTMLYDVDLSVQDNAWALLNT